MIEQLLERVVNAESQSVIRAYENRIRDLEAQKIEFKEKIASFGKPVRGFRNFSNRYGVSLKAA